MAAQTRATSPSQSPVLKVTDLSVDFRSGKRWTNVLRGVDFSINRGETVALVGESGSGKSVTSLAIMRLLDESRARIAGRIELAGQDLLSLSDEAMRKTRGNRVAMIFQEPMTSLNPVMKVGPQIAETLIEHQGFSQSDARREAIKLLDLVRVPSAGARAEDYPFQLSGGMRQRAMIAMALACKPELLIADEPTTALDVTVQSQILSLILHLQKELAMGVLFITHDLGVVAEVSDRAVVMYKGDIVETGDTAAILHRPQSAYTKSLLASVPLLGSMQGHGAPRRFAIYDRDDGQLLEPDTAQDVPVRSDAVLEVKNLVTRFDIGKGVLRRVESRVHAVEDVSLTLRQGETLSIVGESGCGKSTLARSILGLARPQSGSVWIGGQRLSLKDKAQLAKLRRASQMIFQDPYASLDPSMKIGAAIAEPLVIHKICNWPAALEAARALLVQVGLEQAHAERYPHEFSGGQRQRICIARGLALQPKLIVADEAVSALDVTMKAQVLNLMMNLQQSQGIAFLFISHDMAVVERISHRVAVMYLGEIVEIGPRASVFNNPTHPYTRKLLAAVPTVHTRRRSAALPAHVELPSPIKPVDYQPPKRRYAEVSDGHFYMLDD